MPKGEQAENSDRSEPSTLSNLYKLFKGVFDKLFALFGIIIVAMVVSQLFAYPEFMIRSNTTYVEFVIPKSTVEKNNDLWWPATIPLKTITIEAKNYYNPYLKNYDYPIFLNYSFVDDKGTAIPRIPGIKVNIEPKNRQIFADKGNAAVTIGLVGKVAIQDYNLRIWGRGGGGESFRIAEGPLQGSVNVQSSGKEPMHYCTVTIILANETKDEYTYLNGTNAKEILTSKSQGGLSASNNIALNPKIQVRDM